MLVIHSLDSYALLFQPIAATNRSTAYSMLVAVQPGACSGNTCVAIVSFSFARLTVIY